ncbi:hypothetical protein RvY_08158 [Ramazzottius varieornatus]|uniref:Phosphoribosyltransferase domain-containing protein n=1 Tax=Ramazzottius varieornatus TaxID=947166 RepID=A0A1D1V4U6_RAMVA|nr:hypothetical protein RvY_08158 [Ramazzottius varieornatus]
MSKGMEDAHRSSSGLIIPDEAVPYPVQSFSIPEHHAEHIESILIPEGLIRDRATCLAREIFHLYASSSSNPEALVLVCVLKSAFKFFCALQCELENLNAEVARQPSGLSTSASNVGESNLGTSSGSHTSTTFKPVLPLMFEFIRVKSYLNTSSTGSVQIHGVVNPMEAFGDKNVLIVEDMIDSGRTMVALLEHMNQYRTKSIRVASLLWKRLQPGKVPSSFRPHFYGFQIPDRFVIGFGMDYNEKFRDLNHLCVINQHGIDKYKATA